MKHILKTAVCAAAMLAASPASGQPKNLEIACSFQSCVYDTHKQIVGLKDGSDNLDRIINRIPYEMYYDSTGIFPENFYFASSDCTGTKYILIGYIKPDGTIGEYESPPGIFDGSVIWIPSGPAIAVQVNSYGLGPSPTCGVYYDSGETIGAKLAIVGDTTKFFPPFQTLFGGPPP